MKISLDAYNTETSAAVGAWVLLAAPKEERGANGYNKILYSYKIIPTTST